MTAPDNQDPWGSLADSLGLPAGSDAEKSGETAASTPPAAPPPASKPAKPEPVRRDPKPAAPADWGALASDFGLEPEPTPAAKPQPAKPAAAAAPHAHVEARASDQSGPAQGQSEQRRERTAAPSQPAKRAEHDDIAQKLATGSRLWDDEPAAPPAKPAPARAPRPEPAPEPEAERTFSGPDFMEREVRKVREPVAGDDVDDVEAERPAAEDDGDEDRPRRRRRGRRGGRGRSRSRRDEESRDHDDADASVRESDAGDEELADRFDEDREAAQTDRDEDGEAADAESREEPRRGRSRRGRGRRSRRGSDAEGSRRPSRDEEGEDRLDDREPRGEDDELTDAVGEGLESSEDAVGEDGEPRKKRRRRGRRGGRRRSSKTREGEASSDEADDDSSDDSTPTGYVGAAKPGKAEGGRRKEAEGEKSGDERRRRRRRGRGSSSDEKSGSRGRGRPAFRPVSSSFSQDDEGLEYLGLDDAEDGDAPLPARRSDADTDEAVAESGLDAVREVPSWVEAIGIVIAGNLDARAKSPRQDNGRSSRGRSGR